MKTNPLNSHYILDMNFTKRQYISMLQFYLRSTCSLFLSHFFKVSLYVVCRAENTEVLKYDRGFIFNT